MDNEPKMAVMTHVRNQNKRDNNNVKFLIVKCWEKEREKLIFVSKFPSKFVLVFGFFVFCNVLQRRYDNY